MHWKGRIKHCIGKGGTSIALEREEQAFHWEGGTSIALEWEEQALYWNGRIKHWIGKGETSVVLEREKQALHLQLHGTMMRLLCAIELKDQKRTSTRLG